MNYKLIDAIQHDNHQMVRLLMAKVPDSSFIEIIQDEETVKKIIILATDYMNKATADVSQSGTWEALVSTTQIAEGTRQLISNPAILNYTQTVMLLVLAILSNDPKKNSNEP